jgi:hypothetical protein
LSDESHPNWSEPYALARQEKDPARRAEMYARARHLIQDRQIELARSTHEHEKEMTELEAALPELWMMEQNKE